MKEAKKGMAKAIALSPSSTLANSSYLRNCPCQSLPFYQWAYVTFC